MSSITLTLRHKPRRPILSLRKPVRQVFISKDTERDLRRWGYYIRRQVYEFNTLQCSLQKLIIYGMHVPSGYYSEVPIADPRIKQTQRVLVFMPEHMFGVMFLHYVLDGSKSFKARRMTMQRQKFDYWLIKGKEFYQKYRRTDFSVFDDEE